MKNSGDTEASLCDSSYSGMVVLHNSNVTHTASSVTIAIKASYSSSTANTVFKNFFLYVDSCHYSCATCDGPSKVIQDKYSEFI